MQVIAIDDIYVQEAALLIIKECEYLLIIIMHDIVGQLEVKKIKKRDDSNYALVIEARATANYLQ